jgi:hypothetical protein
LSLAVQRSEAPDMQTYRALGVRVAEVAEGATEEVSAYFKIDTIIHIYILNIHTNDAYLFYNIYILR